MEEKIIEYINSIQKEKNIEILLACETGSRAWGFPSPDSDYDVRIIYKHEKDWYLNLNEKKDTIERMFENNEIDISGWDLKKSLLLLRKSNPPLLERIQSPIIYFKNEEFVTEISSLAKLSYSKIGTMYHYLSMAKNMFEEIRYKKEIKLKKLFYSLRTSIACKWIVETDEIPPITFQTMLVNLDIQSSIKERIIELIELKSTKNESYIHHEEIELNNFIESIILKSDTVAKSLPSSSINIEDLNIFFKKMLSS